LVNLRLPSPKGNLVFETIPRDIFGKGGVQITKGAIPKWQYFDIGTTKLKKVADVPELVKYVSKKPTATIGCNCLP
jgi:hypothetical protein